MRDVDASARWLARRAPAFRRHMCVVALCLTHYMARAHGRRVPDAVLLILHDAWAHVQACNALALSYIENGHPLPRFVQHDSTSVYRIQPPPLDRRIHRVVAAALAVYTALAIERVFVYTTTCAESNAIKQMIWQMWDHALGSPWSTITVKWACATECRGDVPQVAMVLDLDPGDSFWGTVAMPLLSISGKSQVWIGRGPANVNGVRCIEW